MVLKELRECAVINVSNQIKLSYDILNAGRGYICYNFEHRLETTVFNYLLSLNSETDFKGETNIYI